MSTLSISAVAFEEAGVWIVQGIEYDICTHAKDPANVPQAFLQAIAENIRITQHLGREPLQGIKPAPAHFKELFDQALTQLRSIRDDFGVQEEPIAAMDIRLAEPRSVAA
jgi:hypothetical protein